MILFSIEIFEILKSHIIAHFAVRLDSEIIQEFVTFKLHLFFLGVVESSAHFAEDYAKLAAHSFNSSLLFRLKAENSGLTDRLLKTIINLQICTL